MKYLKMLGLAAVAAMALMAFAGAGTASATVLCKKNPTAVPPAVTGTECPKGEDYPSGTVIDGSQTTATAILETTGGSTLDTCTGSTVKGKTSTTGGATATVTGPIEELTWTGCTFPTSTVTKGSLEIHWIPGTHNGTLTAKGTEVTINTGFFGACTYGASATGTDLGTITGGNPATMTINALVPLIKNESGLCPSEARWTSHYTVTSPTPLYASETAEV
jgi:hypothetical protein